MYGPLKANTVDFFFLFFTFFVLGFVSATTTGFIRSWPARRQVIPIGIGILCYCVGADGEKKNKKNKNEKKTFLRRGSLL